MKKRESFSLLALTALTIGFTACNSDGNSSASADTASATTTTATTTQTSSRNYAAMADSFKTNSEAGNYLDPRSGKPVRITVSSSGTLVNENGTPIRRYVDRRTWWVYDANAGDTVGSARLENGSLRYRGGNDRWMSYDERWQDDSDIMGGTSHMSNMDSGNTDRSNMDKNNSGKTSEFKIKTDNKKIKGDEDGVKVKEQ